jgi:hypothetical protein
MSTQITAPARNRMDLGRGWLVGAILVVSLGVAAATFVALRDDGPASTPAPASVATEIPNAVPVTGAGLVAPAAAGAVSGPVGQHEGLSRHAAERPGWSVPAAKAGGPSPEWGCATFGRHPC